MSDKYKSLKVAELKDLLQKAGLPASGKKDDLIERLVKHDQQNDLDKQMEAELANLVPKDDNFEFDDDPKINLDDLMPPQGDLDALTSPSTIPPKLVANQAESKSAASPEPVAKPSGFKFTPLSFDKLATSPTGDGDGAVLAPRTTAVTSPQASTSSSSTEAANIGNLPNEEQRKLDRAKRFGIPLSEETKKTVRAAKFGVPDEKQTISNNGRLATTTSPTKNGNTSSVRESKPAIDPEVLKRRQERFGIISGNNNRSNKAPTATTKVLDPVEEEKKRKRLERFGLASSDTLQKGEDGGPAKKSKS